MYKLTKIGADGAQLSADAANAPVIRVDRELLAFPIFVANASPAERVNWEEAKIWAEGLKINGWAWRLPTVEEAFLICNHNRAGGVLDPVFFDQVEIGWAWTSTIDPDTSGYARDADLDSGDSSWYNQGNRNPALAVRACQSL